MGPEHGSRFRTLHIETDSAGLVVRPTSLESSALSLSPPITVKPFQPHLARVASMDGHDKANTAAAITQCDTPTVMSPDAKHQQLPRSPAKMSTPSSKLQSLPARNLPLRSATAHTTTPANANKVAAESQSPTRRSSPVKESRSRPLSPVKLAGSRPSSRPSSRPNSPLKWTPAPGKNEHFEKTPTGFRYTIELPESKIAPKKKSSASPNKATITPVKNTFSVMTAESPTTSVGSRRGGIPSKSRSQSPRKMVLKGAPSPDKKLGDLDGSAPSPKTSPPKTSSPRKRNSVKLTKTDGTHAGPPTVEVTKGDVWTDVQLRGPSTPSNGSIEKEKEAEKTNKEEGVNESNARFSKELPTEIRVENEEKVENPSSRNTSIPTNFGEMLRNSSQEVLQTRASPNNDFSAKHMFSSPTILEKAKRKSDIKTVSFRDVVKTSLNDSSPVEDVIAPIVKDFAYRAGSAGTNAVAQGSSAEARNSKNRSLPSDNSPRTPTGTPPALMAAMYAEMGDIRTTLRRSLGDGYKKSAQTPDSTRWLGSSTNGQSPNFENTPRLNLHQRMAAVRDNSGTKTNGTVRARKAALPALAVRTNGKALAEAQTPFRSRLPRLSPTKLRSPPPQMQMPSTIPKAPRESPFDMLLHGGLPSMAAHRARYERESLEADETMGFASAEEIAAQVREWHEQEFPEAKSPAKATTKPRSKPIFMSPTATGIKKQNLRTDEPSYTPPGSPAKPNLFLRSARKTDVLPPTKTRAGRTAPKKALSSLKDPKIRALAKPGTPLPRNKVSDPGAFRTPSKETASKLDEAIDKHLAEQKRQGRVFTPSGQRISDLIAAKRRSEGLVEEDE